MSDLARATPEFATFQVRYHRYYSACTEDFPTMEEALIFAYHLFDYGEGSVSGIWEGDDQIHDDWSYIEAYEQMK